MLRSSLTLNSLRCPDTVASTTLSPQAIKKQDGIVAVAAEIVPVILQVLCAKTFQFWVYLVIAGSIFSDKNGVGISRLFIPGIVINEGYRWYSKRAVNQG